MYTSLYGDPSLIAFPSPSLPRTAWRDSGFVGNGSGIRNSISAPAPGSLHIQISTKLHCELALISGVLRPNPLTRACAFAIVKSTVLDGKTSCHGWESSKREAPYLIDFERDSGSAKEQPTRGLWLKHLCVGEPP